MGEMLDSNRVHINSGQYYDNCKGPANPVAHAGSRSSRGPRGRVPKGYRGPPPMGPPTPLVGPGFGMQPPMQRPSAPKFAITHQSFDPVHADGYFQRCTEQPEDNTLTEALLKRTQELTPSTAEHTAVQNLVLKIEQVIEFLILAPTGLNIPIDEVRVVGSHKKGTMLAGHPVADMVIILKEVPAVADIEVLAQKMQDKLKADHSEEFPFEANEGGINISSAEGAIARCLVTTLPKNLLRTDPQKHVDVKLLEGALATIRHARWFEENASHTSVRVLVRMLKDMKRRYSGFQGLTPWLIDLLAHRSAMANNSREPLPINVSFKRIIQLLAAGIFLPGSVGIIDPCETGQVRAHSVLSLEEQDQICLTAQTLLRCFAHGAYNEILGLSSDGASLALDTDITSWGGTIVTPGQTAYSKEDRKKDDDGPRDQEGKEGEAENEEASGGAQEEQPGQMEI